MQNRRPGLATCPFYPVTLQKSKCEDLLYICTNIYLDMTTKNIATILQKKITLILDEEKSLLYAYIKQPLDGIDIKEWSQLIIKCCELLDMSSSQDQIKNILDLYNEFTNKHPRHYGYKQKVAYHISKELLRVHKDNLAATYINDYLYNAIAKEAKLQDPQIYNNEYFSFRSFSQYALLDIENESISFAHPREFNDPLDTYFNLWLNSKIRLSKEQSDIDFFSFLKKTAEHIKLRCLIHNQNSEFNKLPLLMWSHYADCHKGFCVKYKFSEEFFKCDSNTKSPLLMLKDVDYVEFLKIQDSLDIKKALFTKSKDWRYENETRLLYYDINDIQTFPTISFKGCIQAIYLGLRVTEENRRRMEVAIGDKNIPLYQMQIDDTDLTNLKLIRIG